METNILIINFVKDNIILLVLSVASIINIVPPEWAGLFKYNNNDSQQGKAKKITLLHLLLQGVMDGVIRGILIPAVISFGMKNIITLIIFVVISFDLFARHYISGQAVTLVGVGILALYLERLIETGKSIKLFGLLSWEKDK